MLAHLRATFALLATTFVLCCLGYPALLLGLAQILPGTAKGSLITVDGKVVGSTLLSQNFTGEEYFWPRPSAVGYNASAAGGSNWGASNPRLRDRVCQQLGPILRYRKQGPKQGALIAPDIEKWFVSKEDRLADWARTYSTAATNWARMDVVKQPDGSEKYGIQGDFILAWAREHPEVIVSWRDANPATQEAPNPEALAAHFFASWAKVHPRSWPGVTAEKTIRPTTSDPLLAASLLDAWLQERGRSDDLEPVPADFVTASGSGLDPHISIDNALSIYQLDRVAEKRKIDVADLETLIESLAFRPLWGLVGGPRLVNVLELNLELDRRSSSGK